MFLAKVPMVSRRTVPVFRTRNRSRRVRLRSPINFQCPQRPLLVRLLHSARDGAEIISLLTAGTSLYLFYLTIYVNCTWRLSNDPIVYTFSPVSSDSMALNPPATVSSEPLYHISVRINCFAPSFWITTIRRSSDSGEFVGDFECVHLFIFLFFSRPVQT